MKRALYLGLDVGTQGTKGVLVDGEAGVVVGRGSSAYGLIEGLPAGAAEQHPETWLVAVADVVGQLQGALATGELRGIGVSGQQHGLVVLDGAGEVVRPAKLWCDTSTAPEARELEERLGRAVSTGFTASKVAWLARHEPEHWGRVRTVLLPHDYVNRALTGVSAMEAGDASGTGWFDPVARAYDGEMVAAVDERLEACLPPLIAEGSWVGTVTGAAARRFELPVGVPVATGGGDNMMSAVGSGACRPGVVTVSLGTSGTVFTHSTAPVIDPAGLIAPFCASVGGWLPLLCVMNATGVTEEVRRHSGMDHGALTVAAAAVPAGCGGLLWIPYLVGERVPDLPEVRGTMLGMAPGCLDPARLYRAALEGTSLNLGWGVERLRVLGIVPEEVRLVGGAARNPLWRQVLADVLGVPVVPLAEMESAALGAALQALWTERRQAGDGVAPAAVAERFVVRGEPAVPETCGQAVLAEALVRFKEEVARLYGADLTP